MAFVPPVDTLNRGYPTMWGNLGEWSRASGYVEAADALAMALGRAAELRPGHRMVDVGCGAGDQLRVWVESFGVAHVTGVEPDRMLCGRARERIASWGLGNRATVLLGDASDSWGPDRQLDVAVALDSAYFFDSRPAFLRRCRDVVRPGGLLAVTDLVLGRAGASSLARGVAPLFGVPRTSLTTERGYREMLDAHGFDVVRLRDLTHDVLGGFSEWTRSGGHLEDGAAPWPARVGLSATGRAAGWLAGRAGLRYVMVTARRRPS